MVFDGGTRIKYVRAIGSVSRKDQHGNTIYFHGTCQDLTEQKLMEIELVKAKEKAEESEKKYRLLAENSSDVIWVLNLSQQKFTYISPAIFQLRGLTVEEALNESMSDALTPESLELVTNLINRDLTEFIKNPDNPFYSITEVRQPHKDGSLVWVEVSSRYLIMTESGEIEFIGISRNITERKKVENELRESEKNLQTLFDILIEGVALNEVIYDENAEMIDYRVLKVNNSFYSIADFYPGQVVGNVATKLYGMTTESINSFWKEHSKRQTTISNEMKSPIDNKWFFISTSPIIDGKFVTTFFDITERKQAELELLKAKEKADRNMEMILSSQSLAHICSYSTNLNVTDLEKSSWVCSPEFYKIFGIDETYPHTIAGWASFIHPDHREKLLAYHEYVVKNKISFNHEYKIIRINDGVERWVKGTGELVYDEQGKPVRMHGAIQDITEIKNTEDELIKAKEKAEESELKYRLIADNTSDGIMVIGIDTKIQYVSPSYLKQLGYTELEELTRNSNSIYELIHPDDRDSLFALIFAAIENKQTGLVYSYRVKHKYGHYIWREDHAKFNFDPQGNYINTYVVCRDISDRKQAELEILIAKEKTEENEKHLNEAQKLSHIGSWTYNPITQKPNWSDEMFRIWGLDKELGAPEYKEHIKLIHQDDWEIFDLAVKNATEKGIPYHLELRICCPDGLIKTIITICESIINPINGNVVELKGTNQDITERKLIENTQSFLLRYDYLNTNQNFYEDLARFLSETLNMDYICIDTLHGDLLSAKTLAIYFDGKFDENVEYTLKDTPCGDVVGNNICCFTHGVRHLFPDDRVLQEMVAESYIGTTLWGVDAKPIGLIATIGRKSILNTSTAEKILRLAGLKVASEIERIKALQELTESENRLKLATSSGQLGIWDWNVKDNTMIWDDRMFEFYGISKNAFPINLDAWTGGLHHEDKQWAIDECNQALNGEKEFNTSFRIVQPNGTIKYLKADGIVIRDSENNPIRMIGINKDITERKQAEKALTDSEEKYKTLVETSSDAIYLLSEDGTIIDANQAASAMLGRSKDEIIGSMIDSVDPNYPKDEYLKSWNTLSLNETYLLETTHLRKDGTFVPVEVSGKKFKQNENVFHYGIVRDITDRKNKEKEIQNKIKDLQWYYDISISRELKMASLKKEINALTDRLGETRRYL